MARTALTVGISVVLGLCADPVTAQTGAAPATLEIRTVSTRPDTVSGGDVLVQITVPRPSTAPGAGAVAADRLSVTVNRRDVTSAFRPEPTAAVARSGDRIVTGCESARV